MIRCRGYMNTLSDLIGFSLSKRGCLISSQDIDTLVVLTRGTRTQRFVSDLSSLIITQVTAATYWLPLRDQFFMRMIKVTMRECRITKNRFSMADMATDIVVTSY